ncbi:ORCT-like protein [Mya arenaria]|uniref:ORCT-like protein n=1 Tax=Mya arenaria TaxID=6604 RepID=A0ABY7EVX7_MYAAR|nr:ORCT-like protein [Mya arenaria]
MDENLLTPDEVIEELGGCGRFQWRLSIIAHLMKTLAGWSTVSMLLISATPPWRCMDNEHCNNATFMATSNDTASVCPTKSCYHGNATCQNIQFDDGLNTIVTEYKLVCGMDFIPSTTMTIQISGLLVGNLVSGQMGELFGRKRPFFFAVLLFMVFNLVGFFANHWVLFAVCRFFIGIGVGTFMTMKYALLCEFSLASWRSWIIGFPSWPFQACVFALVAWFIQDWRWIPESFRWHVAHNRLDIAEDIIHHVAKVNGKTLKTTEHLLRVPSTSDKDKKHTVLDMFASRQLIVVSVLLALNWSSLSGNIFFNLFLFSVVGIPAKSIGTWLQNKFGRRITAAICFIMVSAGGFVVGGVQSADSFCPPKTCTIGNNSCQNIQFEDGLKTMVTDFELVCDRDFIPSTTQSIQISGALVGNLISGQLGELFGRKRPFFFAIVITMIFNVAGFFANNWILYAVCRFFMGLGEGFFMTIKYALLSEFSLANWRAWIIGFPSWPIQSCLLALCAWLIKDWRYLQLMTAALGIPSNFR